MWKRLKNSKTLKWAIAGILTAVGSYLSEQIDAKELGAAIFVGIGSIFMRDGIAKTERAD